MVKAYLRYEHTKSWGIVCSPDVNACYHETSNATSTTKQSSTSKFLFTAAGETINVFDCSQTTSTGRVRRKLFAPKTYHSSDGSYVASVPRVTAIACSRDGRVVAGGFSDGSVRLWRKPLKGVLFSSASKAARGRQQKGGDEEHEYPGDDLDELYSSDFEDDEEEELEHCTSSVLFRGHKSAVSALAFTEDGTVLVSGGRDTDVVVWDALEEKGLFRLKGHRGQVTSAVFVTNATADGGKGKKARKKSKKSKKSKKKKDENEEMEDDENENEDENDNDVMVKESSENAIASSNFTNVALVTTSKDGFAKVWDLIGQRCCQTLSGFGGECWASAYSKHVVVDTNSSNDSTNHSNDKTKYGIVAIAGVEREIKFYSVFKGVEKDSFLRRRQRVEEEADNDDDDDEDDETKQARENILDRALRLRFIGSFAKEARSRTISMQFSNLGTAFGVQSVGKSIEIYDVKNAEEIEKKRKRRLKRRREKENIKKLKLEEQKRRDEDSDDNNDDDEDEDEDDENKFNAKDAFELSSVVRPTGKSVAPFAFQPETMDSHLSKSVSLAICLDSNAIEVYDIADVSAKKDPSVKEAKKRSMARPSGHRADVRVIALSPDESFLLSVSHSGAKIWDADTGKCARTIESGYGTCAFFAPDGRNAVVGTKDGGLEIIDCLAGTNSASLPEDEEKKKKKKKRSEGGEDDDDEKEGANEKGNTDIVDPLKSAHEGPVWGICALPDESGFVTCSGDKTIKFWEWTLVAANRKDKNGMKKLTATHSKTLQMADDVLSVSITPNGKLLSASLLDNTLKVFFADTLKFSLSLYGHRLPALCHDVSSDSVLLASAGQDKNIRVWGLDFGDCHRSIHAHDDSVMALKFVNKTHYAFTCGKDKRVRYWDLDKYEMLLSMDEHHMAVWTIAISTTGAFLVSAGADRSLRLYERTREPFFLDEEKEKRLDSMFEDNAGVEMDEEDRRNSERVNLENNNGDNTDALNMTVAESGLAGRRTMETLDSADKIAAAVDLAKHELERVAAYENEKRQSADPSKMPPLKPNPLLLNMEPRQYALYQVSQVRPAELERSILCLPFLYCRLLLDYLKYWLERNEKVELCCTMTNLIVRLHFQQLGATREARATLDGLKPLLRSRAKERLDDLGFNIAGMEMIERSAKAKADLTK